jgi:hypothetical protein
MNKRIKHKLVRAHFNLKTNILDMEDICLKIS